MHSTHHDEYGPFYTKMHNCPYFVDNVRQCTVHAMDTMDPYLEFSLVFKNGIYIIYCAWYVWIFILWLILTII